MNNNKRITAAALVGIIVFTAPLFLIDPVTVLMKTAYCTSLIAVCAVCYALYLGNNRKSGMFVTTAAMLLVVWRYAIINILYSGIILALQFTGSWNMPATWFILGHVILVGFTAWQLLAADAGKEAIERVENTVKESVSNWKLLQTQITSIASRTNSSDRKYVENVREAIRYADPVTSPQLNDIENAIKNNIKQLSDAVDTNNTEKIKLLETAIIQQVKERSEICKLLK